MPALQENMGNDRERWILDEKFTFTSLLLHFVHSFYFTLGNQFLSSQQYCSSGLDKFFTLNISMIKNLNSNYRYTESRFCKIYFYKQQKNKICIFVTSVECFLLCLMRKAPPAQFFVLQNWKLISAQTPQRHCDKGA